MSLEGHATVNEQGDQPLKRRWRDHDSQPCDVTSPRACMQPAVGQPLRGHVLKGQVKCAERPKLLL
jgi:hypothetical protein